MAGIINADASPADVVEQCFRSVLLRDVEPVGLASYVPLIEERRLSPRDLIRILADSEEARSRGIMWVIVPVPSPWVVGVNSAAAPSTLTTRD
jgi:hypothetical protein